MSEQSAASAVGERHAPKVTAVDVRDLIVTGKPLVDVGVVGGQQLADAAILTQLGVDEQPRLLPERFAQVLIELRIGIDVGNDAGQFAQREPLAHEVVDQRPRSTVLEHPRDLPLQSGRRARARRARRRSSSSSSGMLLHRKNESRDARSMSLMRYTDPGAAFGGIALDAEGEAWRGEDTPQPALDARFETLFGLARPVETEQRLEILFSHRPTIGATGKSRQNRARAALV